MTKTSELLLRAVDAHRAGRLETAEELYNGVLALDPNNADALNLLGLIAESRGRSGDAVAYFDRALAAKPAFAEAAFNRGNTLSAQGDTSAAEASFRQALAADPAHASAHLNLGSLLYRSKRRAEAEAAFRAMIAHAPNDARGHYNLGRCLLDRKDYAAAEAAVRQAMALNASDIPQRLTLSDIYLATGRTQEARTLLEDTLAAHPETPEVLNALGTVLCNGGDNREGLDLYTRALTLKPDYVNAIVNRGLTLLALGDLKEGWRGYARRFESGEAMFAPRARATPWPPWQGEPLAGKTIFVWGEQAVGDQILYAGMLPDVIARAKKCIIECAPRLTALFVRSFPKAVVVSPEQSADVLSRETVDFHSAVLDLGVWLRPNFASFPARARFLMPDAALVAHFIEKYAPLRANGKRLVGLSWKSTSTITGADKTIPLAHWSELLATPGVSLVSVQYGAQTAELEDARARGIDIHHDSSVDPLGDLDRYAAQLAALDLVISVSNTTVHVAGALGVPTWVIVPEGRGGLWYWFTEGDRSPWYGALRLFRRRAGGNILDDIAAALLQSAAEAGS